MNDHAPLIERAFELEFDERSYPIEPQGEIPEYVRGSYYGNGPARFGRGDIRYRHWLDGDGMVTALRFTDNGITFTNRFVRSTKFTTEEEAGRAVFRTFGTAFEGDRLKRNIGLESPVNLSVWPIANTVIACGEQGLPWELDPITLETRGEYTFGRRLNAISPLSAHPCFDNGLMFNFGISYAARQPRLQVYRFGRQGELQMRKHMPLEFPGSMHDFSLSQRFMVFYLSPHILDVEAFMRDDVSVMEAMRWKPEVQSLLMLVDRETGELTASLPVGSGSRYCLHLINSFERDNRLHVDLVELDEPVYGQYQVLPNLFTEVKAGQPVRYVIDMEDWTLIERIELGYHGALDFPQIDPRLDTHPYRHFWFLDMSKTGRSGRKFFDQLGRLDWEEPTKRDIFHAPERHYLCCEPVFIPDLASEKRGMILCKMFDAENVTDTYLLFDAFNLAQGPVARLPLQEALPAGFHACFAPEGDRHRLAP